MFFRREMSKQKAIGYQRPRDPLVIRLYLHVCSISNIICSGSGTRSREEISIWNSHTPPISIIVVKVSSYHLNLLLKKKRFPSLYSCTSVCPSLLAQHANDDLFQSGRSVVHSLTRSITSIVYFRNGCFIFCWFSKCKSDDVACCYLTSVFRCILRPANNSFLAKSLSCF